MERKSVSGVMDRVELRSAPPMGIVRWPGTVPCEQASVERWPETRWSVLWNSAGPV